MLGYWILKRPDGKAVGLVRVQNDCVLLQVTAPLEGRFMLFSGTDAVPILPEQEVRLSCAEAVLGTDGSQVTCFAAAQNAKPLSAYRNRMNQICTNDAVQDVPPAAQPEPDKDISQIHTNNANSIPNMSDSDPDMSFISTINTDRDPDTVAETARDTEAFSLLLRRAEAFYAAYEGTEDGNDMVQNKDMQEETTGGIDLFSQEYPGARWRYVEGADILPHYEGVWKQPNGRTLHIVAVRGRAAPRPPRALVGFTRYLHDRFGAGYWLRITQL